MSEEIDYGAILINLESRKAAIEAAIAGIKVLMGEMPPGAVAIQKSPTGRVEGPEGIGPGTFFGMTKSEAAKAYLEIVKKKQKTAAICDALQRGGIESSAKNLYSNIFTMLTRDKEFVKVGKYWGLASWFPNRQTVNSPRKKRGSSRRGKGARKAKKEGQTAGSAVDAVDPGVVAA